MFSNKNNDSESFNVDVSKLTILNKKSAEFFLTAFEFIVLTIEFWLEVMLRIEIKFSLVDKIQRKSRTLLCDMPVFNVHYGQSFLRNSVKFLP